MIEKERVPNHVGVIMDGNGRWAKARMLPRVAGHNAGMESMKKIVIAASNMGIKNLTVYAFSTENWKRSTEEVNGIFKLIVKYVKSELEELIENNVHINIIGEYDMLPQDSVEAIDKLVASTKGDDGLNFNIALNYGGRAEIVKSVNALFEAKKQEEVNGIFEPVTEADISRYLYTGSANFDIPDPDLIIRTSGEERMSNFLVWQAAYSELMFTDTLWPDFTPEEFEEMVERFTHRDRRFGGRNKEDK
ncbi:MAG: isoprenyl transferase [Clostridiales bacterium]|nr:isoprenyl transferase [Candidatus Crickella merdequi]